MTVVSGFATSETAQSIAQNLPGTKTLLGGAQTGDAGADLASLDKADLYIVVSTDLTVDYQVVGFAIKRGVTKRSARLYLVSDQTDGMAPWATDQVFDQESAKVVNVARGAQMPVIVCGPSGAELALQMAKQIPNAKVICFAPGGNACGIAAAGIDTAFGQQRASTYYVLAGEAGQVDAELLAALKAADFVAVQASYRQPWDDVADVILPSPTTAEKCGSMINVEGQVGQVVAGVSTGLPSEIKVIEDLGKLVR